MLPASSEHQAKIPRHSLRLDKHLFSPIKPFYIFHQTNFLPFRSLQYIGRPLFIYLQICLFIVTMQGARYLLPFHINAVLCVVISIGRKRNLLGDNCNVFYLPFITSPNATYFKSTIYHISKFYTLFPNGCKREYICHSADKRIRSSRNWMQDNCKN